MRRRSGRPSASFMRSSIGSVWSCQGAVVVVGDHRRPASAQRRRCRPASGAGAPSSRQSPAKKPFSQARCSAENGALGGNDFDGCGGGVIVVMWQPPRQRVLRNVSTSWRSGEGEEAFVGPDAMRRDRPCSRRSIVCGAVLGLDVAIDLAADARVRGRSRRRRTM